MDTTNGVQKAKLSTRHKKYLKGLGHHLAPVVLIGKEGLSASLIEAIILELDRHELIKVKIGNNSGVDKQDASKILPDATKSDLVQLIGKTLLLYRKNPQRPKDERIILP